MTEVYTLGTRKALRSALRTRIGEVAAREGGIGDEELNRVISYCQYDVASRLFDINADWFLRRKSISVVSGTARYLIPSDMGDLLSVTWNEKPVRKIPASHIGIEGSNQNMVGTQEEPRYWRYTEESGIVYVDYIMLSPVPGILGGGSLQPFVLYYTAKPIELSTDGSVTVIPDRFCYLILDAAESVLASRLGWDPAVISQRYENKFELLAKGYQMKKQLRDRLPGEK